MVCTCGSCHLSSHKLASKETPEPSSECTNYGPTDLAATGAAPSSAEAVSLKPSDPSRMKSQTQDESHTPAKDCGKAGSNGHLTDTSKSSESTSASVNIVMKGSREFRKEEEGCVV